MKKKILVPAIALVLVLCCALGGTLAWLTDKDSVDNTFTIGDINIDLTETTGENYHILPGVDIAKDPKVIVKPNSEACWLFIEVAEESWPDFKEEDGTTRKVNYMIANGWQVLDEYPGVYYRAVNTETAKIGTEYGVLENNKVTVSENLTKEELQTVTKQPKLIFTAYAVQYYNGENTSGEETHFTPQEAWEAVSAAKP